MHMEKENEVTPLSVLFEIERRVIRVIEQVKECEEKYGNNVL